MYDFQGLSVTSSTIKFNANRKQLKVHECMLNDLASEISMEVERLMTLAQTREYED